MTFISTSSKSDKTRSEIPIHWNIYNLKSWVHFIDIVGIYIYIHIRLHRLVYKRSSSFLLSSFHQSTGKVTNKQQNKMKSKRWNSTKLLFLNECVRCHLISTFGTTFSNAWNTPSSTRTKCYHRGEKEQHRQQPERYQV